MPQLMPLATAFLFAVLLWSPRAVAQEPACTLVLSGAVIDDHDRTPLSFAEIYLPELQKGTISDLEGRYRLEGLCPGNYLVRVSHLGCEPVERRINLTRDQVMDVRLEHHHEELRELEVIRRKPDENVGQARSELDREVLEQFAGRSLADMVGNLPGVNILSSGPTIGKPVIHGLSGNRILILNQGIRQEDQQWGTDHAPNLDPFSSDRITVVKGAASVQYGSDAIGGVIITEPVELPREGGISGEVRGVGIYNGRGGGGSGMLQGGVKRIRGLGWRVQGSGRQLGDASSANYGLSNTGLRETGGSASVGVNRHWGGVEAYYSWFTRELGVARSAHIGNLTDLQNSIERGTPWFVAPFTYGIGPPRQVVEHQLFKAEGRYRLSDRDMVVLTYAFQTDDRQEYDIRRGGRSERPSLDLFLQTHTADAVLNHWLGPHVHGKLGVSGVQQENFNIPGTGIRPLIPNYAKRSGGVFILEHFPFGERLELEAGARLERTDLRVGRYDRDNNYVTPEHAFVNHALSAGGNWEMRDSLFLRANISTAYRPPHVAEMYSEGLHHGSAAIELGDDGLASERSLKATLDIDGHWAGGRLRTAITLYHDRITDFIQLRPEGFQLTIRGAFPVFSYSATDVRLMGIDAAVEYELFGPWSWRTRASMVRGRDLLADEWLFQMPSDRLENSLVLRRERFGAWRNAEVAVTSLLVAEQTRVPVGLDFMDAPAGYHLLGLSMSVMRPMGPNELRFGLSGHNLLNTAYRDYMDRFRYFMDARGVDFTLWLRFGF
jgi:iron complex outermembrane receptor protein